MKALRHPPGFRGRVQARGVSSAGRASALQAEGHRFDPGTLHYDGKAGKAPAERDVPPGPFFVFGRSFFQTACGLPTGEVRVVPAAQRALGYWTGAALSGEV